MSSVAKRMWIEIAEPNPHSQSEQSSVAKRMWIEIRSCVFALPIYRRHPLRNGCGLKCMYRDIRAAPKRSSVAKRMWIEIKSVAGSALSQTVIRCETDVD